VREFKVDVLLNTAVNDATIAFIVRHPALRHPRLSARKAHHFITRRAEGSVVTLWQNSNNVSPCDVVGGNAPRRGRALPVTGASCGGSAFTVLEEVPEPGKRIPRYRLFVQDDSSVGGR
jgi:hypothetical protein